MLCGWAFDRVRAAPGRAARRPGQRGLARGGGARRLPRRGDRPAAVPAPRAAERRRPLCPPGDGPASGALITGRSDPARPGGGDPLIEPRLPTCRSRSSPRSAPASAWSGSCSSSTGRPASCPRGGGDPRGDPARRRRGAPEGQARAAPVDDRDHHRHLHDGRGGQGRPGRHPRRGRGRRRPPRAWASCAPAPTRSPTGRPSSSRRRSATSSWSSGCSGSPGGCRSSASTCTSASGRRRRRSPSSTRSASTCRTSWRCRRPPRSGSAATPAWRRRAPRSSRACRRRGCPTSCRAGTSSRPTWRR